MSNNHKEYSLKEVYSSAKRVDALVTVLFLDPIAFKLTYFFANFTRVSPNALTIISFILGLSSAVLFTFGTYSYLVLGSLLFQSSSLLDCVDGKLARLTHTESKVGKILEFFRDKIFHLVNLCGLLYGQLLYNHPMILTIGTIYFIVLTFYWVIYRSPLLNSLKISSRYPSYKRITLIPTSPDVIFISFFLGPLTNHVVLGLIIGVILFSLNIICNLLFIIRLGKIRNKIEG